MYTTDSSFLSDAAPSAERWVAAIAGHNPDQAAAIVAAYVAYGPQIGINYDLALAQACHECAWFTSRRWREQFNSCGLGVVSDEVNGATYLNIDDGVKAHYEHLVCYTMAADPPVMAEWGMLDPRHVFHDGMPRVADLVRADRKWAVPGDGYAEAIVALANQVVGADAPVATAPEVTPVSNEPAEGDLGYPVRVRYAPFVGPERAVASIRWFVVHDTEGGEAGSESVLEGPTASAHALIDRDGSTVFMVPLTTTAWTPGNDEVARQSVNVELVGFATEPYTEDQYRCLARFFVWCVGQGMTGVPDAYIGKVDGDGGPESDVPGILGHQDVPNPNVPGAWGGVAGHTDPGPLFDWGHLVTLAGGANPTPGPTGSATYRLFPETKHGIDGGIKTWWEGHANPLADIGFPISEEEQYGGRTTQLFQRAVVQWFPEFRGTPNEFQTMLLGSFFARDVLGRTGLGIPAK